MRRSEKRKEEMYLALELWQESGLSQRAFCQKEGLNYQVFGYWLKKYRQGKNPPRVKPNGFVGLNVDSPSFSEGISIRYPNGVVLTCSEDLDPLKLQALVNL